MKSLYLTVFLVFTTCILHAQDGIIRIEQDPMLNELVELYKEAQTPKSFYQIQLGFGKLKKAKELKAEADALFPQWPARIEFEHTTYRVRIGQFYDILEAEKNFRSVRRKFPQAILLRPEE